MATMCTVLGFLRITLMISLSYIVYVSTVEARLGESEAQCIARYGKPVAEEGPVEKARVSKTLTFDKDGIRIWAMFSGDVCERISYYNNDRIKFADDVTKVFLAANIGSSDWRLVDAPEVLLRGDKWWDRMDGEATAWLMTSRKTQILTIAIQSRQRYSDRYRATPKKRQDKAAKGIKGF